MTHSSLSQTTSAQRRIANLVSRPSVHRAFHWLHLHQPQILNWQLEATRVPAPPFEEGARAAYFLERFRELGLAHVRTDDVGNVLAELTPMVDGDALTSPCVLVSAHLDTVFPASVPCETSIKPPRYLAPGISDNGAGLAALLAIAAAMRFASIAPPAPILFAANVGEEGEGDLRGMRHLFSDGQQRDRIAAAIVLEGTGNRSVVVRGLGSLRLRATIQAAGGHSWADAGTPNPIFLMSRVLASLSSIPLPSEPRTVLNAGLISGGTSINSIPASAAVLLDLRSTDPVQIDALHARVEQEFGEVIHAANASNSTAPVQLQIEVLGRRPAAELPAEAPLLQTIRAVDRHLGLRTELRVGSTDANIPLSLGVPAVALGGGGIGGGIHTVKEWFDPTGREIALRRLLLTILDTSSLLHQQSMVNSP